MAFRPKNDRHAIVEVVFVVTLSRAFEHSEMNAIALSHEKWKSDLPSISRTAKFQVMFGVQPPSPNNVLTPPPGGLSFEAYKRDGTIDWRMAIEDNWIAINCLSYTRWNEIWTRARRLLGLVFEPVSLGENPAIGMALQYIDQFEWEGDISAYKLDELLRHDSHFLPEALWSRGPVWNLDQSWFRQEDLPAAGRLLERMHLNGSQVHGVGIVRIDNTLRLDFGQPIVGRDALLGGESPLIDRVFQGLHMINKQLIKAYITDGLAQRIGLNA